MIQFLAMVFLLPLIMLVTYALLFVTGKMRYFVAVVGIAVAEYIYWLYFVWHPDRLAPRAGVSPIELALVPTLVFISMLMFALYALRRGTREISA